jgi:hypothetical protein
MPGTGDALRRTSDELLRDLEALLQLEEEKRTIDPGDPRLVDLASRIEIIAKRVLDSSTSQRAQTQVVHELTESGSPAAPDTPIEDTPRSMEAILAAWRRNASSRRRAWVCGGERGRVAYRSADESTAGPTRMRPNKHWTRPRPAARRPPAASPGASP